MIGYYVNATAGTQIIQGKPVTNPPGSALLECWNSTQCIEYPSGQPSGFSLWVWRPALNCLLPFSNGIMWAAPLANNISGASLPGTLSFSNTVLNVGSIDSGVCLLTSAVAPATGFTTGFQIEAGYSATTGQQLWIANRTETPLTRLELIGIGDGDYAEVNLATATLTGYSLNTGSQVWTTALTGANGGPANAFDSNGGYMAVLANGVLYTWGFGGDVWAINMATGAVLWYTNTNTLSGLAGSNTPYGVWPLWTFTVGTCC